MDWRCQRRAGSVLEWVLVRVEVKGGKPSGIQVIQVIQVSGCASDGPAVVLKVVGQADAGVSQAWWHGSDYSVGKVNNHMQSSCIQVRMCTVYSLSRHPPKMKSDLL
jgi:hypothetical protein